MIIQIKKKGTDQWFDRCKCSNEHIERELAALKRIYKKNDFRVVDGDKKLPGPIYHNKPTEYIDDIVAGIEWLERQPKDSRYPIKAAKVMQGKIKAADIKTIERFEKMQSLAKKSIRRRNESKRKN